MHPIEAFLIQPDINPLILQIWGPFAIRWYSLMYVLGFMFSYFYIYYQIKKGRIKATEMELSDIIFYAFLGVIIGGRLGYVLFYNLGVYMQNPLDIFKIWEGGLSFHGGFIGVLISEWIYLSTKKKNFLDYADVFIVPLPFCLFLGRWGNFVNGELLGQAYDNAMGHDLPERAGKPSKASFTNIRNGARRPASFHNTFNYIEA